MRLNPRLMIAGALLITVCVADRIMVSVQGANRMPTEVEINIVGRGSRAKYIEKGASMQQDVNVIVGQSVRWRNQGNVTHTATSEGKDAAGNKLFDTLDVLPGVPDGVVIPFDRALYRAAGGTPGGQVILPYLCEYHDDTMRSRIILSDAAVFKTSAAAGPTVLRKNARFLPIHEVENLRIAVQNMKDSGTYEQFVELHQNSAEHYTSLFLPWHRAFLYYFEEALQQAHPTANPPVSIPYWNYDQSEVDYRYLPEPLRPATVGGTPNSLHRSRYQGWNAGTRYLPYGSVRTDNILTSTSQFRQFRQSLENGPHSYVHNDVSSVMSNLGISPRDPAFWFHHSNVDRVWDKWNSLGNQNPNDPDYKALPLAGFEDKPKHTAGEFLDIESLNYEYARQVIDRKLAFDADRRQFSCSDVSLRSIFEQGDYRVLVEILGLVIPTSANVSAQVYITPMDEEAVADRHRIGTFTLLAVPEREGEHPRTTDMFFDATEAVQQLAKRNIQEWCISIIPAAGEEEVKAETLTFNRLRIIVRDQVSH